MNILAASNRGFFMSNSIIGSRNFDRIGFITRELVIFSLAAWWLFESAQHAGHVGRIVFIVFVFALLTVLNYMRARRS
jgi:hypothetical protein